MFCNEFCPALHGVFDYFLLQCNRYPLHYAYALPQVHGEKFIELLLEQNPQAIEQAVDKVSDLSLSLSLSLSL